MSTTDVEASAPLARARFARQVIEAVLAGAQAAETGQAKQQTTPTARTNQKVNELMQEYNALYKEGKYKEAEMYAAAAHELDPDNAIIDAALQIARAQRRRGESLEKARSEAPEPKSPGETGRSSKLPALTPDLSRPITPTTKGDKEKDIEKCLLQRVNLSFNDTPLIQVLEDLHAWHGLNIVIDRPALLEGHISLATPVTIRLENVTFKSALNLLLHSAHLAYVVRDGILVVTTPEAARGRLVTATYQVADLVGGDTMADALIRLIVRTVAPESWDERGGSGTIEYFRLGTALVVKQTPDVQEQIADFLAALRRLTEGAKEKQP